MNASGYCIFCRKRLRSDKSMMSEERAAHGTRLGYRTQIFLKDRASDWPERPRRCGWFATRATRPALANTQARRRALTCAFHGSTDGGDEQARTMPQATMLRVVNRAGRASGPRMSLVQRLEVRQGQALVMTPQLLQAIKLLQLSQLDLAAYVETELE